MQITAQQLCSQDTPARVGYLTRLKLIPVASVMAVVDPQLHPLAGRPFTVSSRGLIISLGTVVTEINFAVRLASFAESLQNDSNSYQVTIVAGIPRPSADLLAWLADHDSQRFVAVWQDAAGQTYLAGEPNNALKLSWSRALGDKDTLSITLAGRSWHPSWFLETYENAELFKTRPFSYSFSVAFDS